ncbi:MAG: 50S ribosomal protein L3 [Coriobacteriia bacterium]|nr:50S ribosomal protein L3 [Coriobacteriia bacterium]
MIQTIYGKKVGMTQVYSEDDRVLPVTVLSVEPNVIAQVKTSVKNEKTGKTDGYNAVQLAFGSVRKDNKGKARVNKPTAGHFKKVGIEPTKYLREVRLSDEEIAEVKSGDKITVANFAEVKKVDVTGTSKGKGFAGAMKRHGFGGGPGGHGSHFHRAPGSIGMCATPSRVLKGMRLPGHMGVDTVTTKNLELVRIDEEQNIMLIKGAVPGGKNAILKVKAVK